MSILFHLVITAASLWVTTQLVSGVTVSSTQALVLAALALGIVNAVVRPILHVLSFPLTVITLGLFYFVVNGIAFGIAAAVVPGFEVNGVMAAILGALVLSVVSWLLHLVLPDGKAGRKG
jgi:putative membrane protein